MTSTYYLRFVSFISSNKNVVSILCVLFGVMLIAISLSSFITPSLFDSGEFEDNEMGHSATIESSHGAEITESTSTYMIGEYITNNGAYPYTKTSELDYWIDYEEDNLEIKEYNSSLELTVTSRQTDNIIWQDKSNYLQQSDDEGYKLDIDAHFNQMNDLRSDFGSNTQIEAEIITVIEYEYTDAYGEVHSDEKIVEDEITRDDVLYYIDDTSEFISHTSGEVVDTRNDNTHNYILLGIGILFISGFLIRFKTFDDKSINYKLNRKRFEDWVTKVDTVNPRVDVTVVTVKSMKDIVDLAIDTQNRVIYSESVNEYIVFHDNNMYIYSPDIKSGSLPRISKFGIGQSSNTENYWNGNTDTSDEDIDEDENIGEEDDDWLGTIDGDDVEWDDDIKFGE